MQRGMDFRLRKMQEVRKALARLTSLLVQSVGVTIPPGMEGLEVYRDDTVRMFLSPRDGSRYQADPGCIQPDEQSLQDPAGGALMARIIPPICEGSLSPGEPPVFAASVSATRLDHPLQSGYCPVERNKQTEIDFLGHHARAGLPVHRGEGARPRRVPQWDWHLGSKRTSRGPLKQADDARFTLARRIQAHLPRYPTPPFIGASLPCALFELPPNISAHAWECLDMPGSTPKWATAPSHSSCRRA